MQKQGTKHIATIMLDVSRSVLPLVRTRFFYEELRETCAGGRTSAPSQSPSEFFGTESLDDVNNDQERID